MHKALQEKPIRRMKKAILLNGFHIKVLSILELKLELQAMWVENVIVIGL